MGRRPTIPGLLSSLRGRPPRVASDQIYKSGAGAFGGGAGGGGPAGADGRDAGFAYTYLTDTANSDPGSGRVKFNSVTFASINRLRISETDADGNSLFNFLATIDDPTSAIRGHILMRKVGSPATFALFTITGALTDNGTWDEVVIAHVLSAGTFNNLDAVMLNFYRTGDKGDQGPQGIQGNTGSQGPSGPAQPLRSCDGRLTVVSGDAVPSADQTAKSTLYFTPYNGNQLDLYTGSAWASYSFTERSLALSGLTSGKNYDVFIADVSGTLTLELVAWTDDTNRATALVKQDGVWVKSGATTRRYLGTIRTTGTTTTEDSAAKRFVWNLYNRRRRMLKRHDATDSWSYGTDAWRQARADAANQVEDVRGIDEDVIELSVEVGCNPSPNLARVGISTDGSTTAISADCSSHWTQADSTSNWQQLVARLVTSPGVGYHAYKWLERVTGTVTFFGDNASDQRAMIHGTVFA